VLILPGVTVSRRLIITVKPATDAVLELRSQHGNALHRIEHIGVNGEVAPIALPPGHYCFRVKADGFNATVGRLEIRPSAPDVPIDVQLHVAN